MLNNTEERMTLTTFVKILFSKTKFTQLMKIFYSMMVGILLSVTAMKAQLPDLSFSPNWMTTDINGVDHELYNYLDSGYAVFIDLSATWCGPCWRMHQEGLLDNLYNTYGPDGTNEMRVIYIESDPNTTLADLNGTGSNTQGNWVGTHPYPFVDDASIRSIYQLASYPTVVLITPDRLTHTWVGYAQGSAAAMAAEIYGKVGEGPLTTYTNDVRALKYNGELIATCESFNAGLTFQNYGSENLTAASFEVVGDDSVILGTADWTGDLATYELGNVDFGQVNAEGYSNIVIRVSTDDEGADNNQIGIDAVTFIKKNSLNNVFDLENTPAGSFELPDGWTADAGNDFTVFSLSQAGFNDVTWDVGAYEQSVRSIFFWFYDAQADEKATVYLDKIDMTSVQGSPVLKFDHAYRQYSTELDKLQIEVSVDCGETWTAIFDESGASLSTVAPGTASFFPRANEWTSTEIDMSDYATAEDLAIRLVATSGYGNNLFVDNITVEGKSGVNEVEYVDAIRVFPNPTNDVVTLSFNAEKSNDMVIQITDLTGKIINQTQFETITGKNDFTTDVTSLTAGTYFINLVDGSSRTTKRFVKL